MGKFDLKHSNYSSNEFDTSVIIVNWNAGKYLQETIKSLYEQNKDVLYEVIIIDNFSNKDDESYLFLTDVLKHENVTVVKCSENLGFAKANNMAMKMANGRNFLILNPDVIFHNNVIKILSDYSDKNSDVGMVGPKVLNPDGSFQQPCLRGKPYPKDTLFHLIGLAKAFPKKEFFNGYALWHLDREQIQNCWALSGCCMMVKKSLFEQIGGMDEQFFMYQEETDWGIRTKNIGKEIVYNPNAIVTHIGGVTTKRIKIKSIYIFTQSMEKFFKKHFWEKYNFIQKVFWLTLIWGNFGLKCIKKGLE